MVERVLVDTLVTVSSLSRLRVRLLGWILETVIQAFKEGQLTAAVRVGAIVEISEVAARVQVWRVHGVLLFAVQGHTLRVVGPIAQILLPPPRVDHNLRVVRLLLKEALLGQLDLAHLWLLLLFGVLGASVTSLLRMLQLLHRKFLQ